MFKLARDKYIAALESAEELEKTLQKENENLGMSSKKLSENWWGTQAEISLRAINESLEISNHAKALAYTQGMTSIMGEYLPELEKMMAKREQIGQQLKQDEYVEPDLTSFSENELIVNYEYIDDIKADVEGALHYGDKAIEILEGMIEDAEECAGEYLDLTHVRELLEEGKKKLHRMENYRDEFVDFGKKMLDLEYNMSMDLSNVMRAQGDTTLLKNPTITSYIDNISRVKEIGKINKKQEADALSYQGKELCMTLPEPGDEIEVSLGIDRESQMAKVSKTNAWSIEYSIAGCNKNFPNSLCTKRLNYVLDNYDYNEGKEELLQFSINDMQCYAGAMIEGFGEIGDVAEITLDDGTKFNFLILDVKSKNHSSSELQSNSNPNTPQCQNQYGHGYMLNGGTIVQLSICEFIVSESNGKGSATNYSNGEFLKSRYVKQATIIGHITIDENL